jgi:hypothetical protein
MNGTWCKIRSATVVMLALFLSACWGGHTTRFVLALDDTPLSGQWRQTNVASVARDPDGMMLINVGVKPWGKFDDDDQANIETSLKDTLATATQGHSFTDEGTINIHLMIRKYIVAISNNAAYIWAGVDWCVADANNRVLFHEIFYATSTGHLVVTTGGVKDDVNRAIVKRIAETTIHLAANSPLAALNVPDTYSTFVGAAATMPETLRSWPVPAPIPIYGGTTATTLVGGTAPEHFPLALAEIKESIDWQMRLNGGH